MKNIWRVSMATIAGLFISFSTSALEMKTKTFEETAVDTDIVVPPISSHSVTSVIPCATSCDADLRCKSFTICQQGEGNLLCKLFTRDIWAAWETRYVPSCSFYKENDSCEIVQNNLIYFLVSLGISVQPQLWGDQKESSCCQERIPKKAKMLENLQKVSKSWFVTFDIKPIGLVVDWGSILHFSTGQNIERHGDRIPGIFFYPNTTKLHVTSSVNDQMNFVTKTSQELPLNVWTKVVVMQNKNDAGNYIFRVFVNMQQIQSIQNNNAQEFENVTVWMGDPWHDAAITEVKNLFYFNLQ